MLTFEWNALRVGDRVLVHDDHDPALPLDEGVVVIVERRRGGPRSVGIRNSATGEVQQPRRHAVHLTPLDAVPCWRCAANGRSAVPG
jgi:hypothetical protein